MADRGRNPVRSFRLGAVVLLAMAGTAVTLVVSEWPLVGQSIAGKAARTQAVAMRSPMRAVPVSVRNMFMPAEPDPYAMLPDLMTAGSAAESRRIAQQLAETIPPDDAARGWVGDGYGCGRTNMHEFYAWQQATPTARFIDHAVARAAARADRSGNADSAGGTEPHRFDIADDERGQRQTQATDEGRIDPHDLSVRLDLASMPSVTDTPSFEGATDFRLVEYRRPEPMDAAAGNDAKLRLGPNSMLRASANGEAPGVIRDYVDLRLEQVWNLGGASSFSVGWRHMRGIMSNELPEPTVRQDAILLELKIGF